MEQLLPAVWDDDCVLGIRSGTEPDPEMPRTKPDPKLSGTLWAHIADIKRAWDGADVPQVERQALFLRYGLDWKADDIGKSQGVHRTTASRRIEAGVGRLTAWLNGKTYDDGDTDLDDEDVQV